MAKKKLAPDFPFYQYLRLFHEQNKKVIYASYQPLTRKFLNFNDYTKATAFLRKPQFEALEMYVFLKEFLNNAYLHQIFADWYHKNGPFAGRTDIGINQKTQQITLFGPSELLTDDKEVFQAVFTQIEAFRQTYPNYIFALTMGLGKTILMATSIFYEFLLANKYPQDPKFCHNALVFAPDKTVLQSLRELETFDKSKVVPPEYLAWLEAHIKFHFLDESGDALNVIDRSLYNIIVTNTQKVILKRQNKSKTATDMLFADIKTTYKIKELNSEYDDLYQFDVESEAELVTNQRFEKLKRLKNLGIYVDEAHHVFGNALAQDFIVGRNTTSLRATINALAKLLADFGTQVVGCYNYTGTPYVGSRLLPEVVYAYGLRDAIDNKYLKRVRIKGYENVRDQTKAFLREAVENFWENFSDKRYDGLLPKMALFATTIEEAVKVVRPLLEEILAEKEISTEKILINVGDSNITTNDNIRDFNLLDTPGSNKQFIILVNKGKEGWNCRSLFSVVMHREPSSKVFVLQATMRCLRAIGQRQETAQVFLSSECVKILETELEQNFKLTVDDLNGAGEDGNKPVEVRVVPPPVKIKITRCRKLHQLMSKQPPPDLDLELEKADTSRYRIIVTERNIVDIAQRIGKEQDRTFIKDKRVFSELTLVAEIARYLNLSPFKIKALLFNTKQGTNKILQYVNDFNELLYDWVIPRLFTAFFDVIPFERNDEIEIDLVKPPKDGYFQVTAKEDMLVSYLDDQVAQYKEKSFHLDHYCFDSKPEKALFWHLLQSDKVEKVWFTGMLTHGQTDFMISYIDPESNTLRSYYPDFLIRTKMGDYHIIEVKADYLVDSAIVKAKEKAAREIASSSQMNYLMVKGSDAIAGIGITIG